MFSIAGGSTGHGGDNVFAAAADANDGGGSLLEW